MVFLVLKREKKNGLKPPVAFFGPYKVKSIFFVSFYQRKTKNKIFVCVRNKFFCSSGVEIFCIFSMKIFQSWNAFEKKRFHSCFSLCNLHFHYADLTFTPTILSIRYTFCHAWVIWSWVLNRRMENDFYTRHQ